jgi:hypothetical protein
MGASVMIAAVTYDELIAEALTTELQGWDFTLLQGRVTEDPLPWSYGRLLLARLPDTASLLDLGTGGGEFLSNLAPLPPRTAATEGYPPNLPLARHRLEPLGVEVKPIGEDNLLPFPVFLRLVSWRVPDFDVNRYAHSLRVLHAEMQHGNPLTAHAHRFALLATPERTKRGDHVR